MSTKDPQKRLGRGLAALFGDVQTAPVGQGETLLSVAIHNIVPSRFQARRHMDEGALRELADSISEQGLLQPLLVRQMHGTENGFEIVAGERRWRAAQLAQMHFLPVIVRHFTDQEAMAVGLVENLQREDLNAIDEAEGYQRLVTEFKLTQEKLAAAVGKSRGHVSNAVRLLTLPTAVLEMVRQGSISSGHARALVNHAHPLAAAREIVAKHLTVRQIEQQLAKQSKAEPTVAKPGSGTGDADAQALAESLSEKLGVRVKVGFDGKGGTILINYKNLDQLDELLRLLNG